MSKIHPFFILAGIFVAVFIESAFDGFRHLFGAQIDFLPTLLVYAGLNTGVWTIASAAVFGGLWFDSLSANPLGVSVLPLLMLGLLVHRARELLAFQHSLAQFALGFAASALQPLIVLFILLNIGAMPLLGWKSVWQWLVMAVGGGLFAPLWFMLYRRVNLAFQYQPASESSFRPDRQIKRGRH